MRRGCMELSLSNLLQSCYDDLDLFTWFLLLFKRRFITELIKYWKYL